MKNKWLLILDVLAKWAHDKGHKAVATKAVELRTAMVELDEAPPNIPVGD